MDNNINNALGVIEPQKNDEIEEQKETTNKDDNTAENTLNTIAWATLIIGIIVALICLFTVCWTTTTVVTHHYTYIPDSTKDVTTFNPMGFAMTIGIFLSSLVSWAFLRVISNISISLKDIKNNISVR